MNVIVDKAELLATLQANRDNHGSSYKLACDGFRAEAVRRIDRMLTDARGSGVVTQYVGLIEPQDHTGDYDRVIRLFSMSVDSRAVLSEREFGCYVMDQWEWANDFRLLTTSYAAFR
jgi:hypothetical protein